MIVSLLPKEITVSAGFVVLAATLLASQVLSVAAVTIDDKRGQIDVVIDRREIRNCVGAGRLVENKLICATAARERIVVAGGENHVLAGRARQRHGRRGAGGEVKDKIHRIGCAKAVGDRESDLIGRRRGCRRDCR